MSTEPHRRWTQSRSNQRNASSLDLTNNIIASLVASDGIRGWLVTLRNLTLRRTQLQTRRILLFASPLLHSESTRHQHLPPNLGNTPRLCELYIAADRRKAPWKCDASHVPFCCGRGGAFHDELWTGDRVHPRCASPSRPIAASLLTCIFVRMQIASTWHPTPMRQTKALRFHTRLSLANPQTSDPQEPRTDHRLYKVADRHCHPSTSPSTEACCTMLSTPTLAPYTLDICTDSPCNYMMSSGIRTTRTERWCSGAVQIRGVSATHAVTGKRQSLTLYLGRANAACILAVYMVLIQNWPPHLALAPIAQMDPPCMPFRDAGYSQADYSLTIQDVVYGVWKAKEEGLVGLKDFSLEEYERYERVDQGDFNWVTPSFLAFASPQHQPTQVVQPNDPLYSSLPRSLSALQRDKSLPMPFRNVLTHFAERGIGLVVRLNSELYSPSYFTALGIKHLDMIFDDGTCPPLNLVRTFVNLAHKTINDKRKGIAVHCKAGLGRTGCLIGAYLIYRHGFTANEVIAFMRFMRPGMVVGPQQHWLHLNQGTFREWWFEDTMKAKNAASVQPSTPNRLHHSSSRRLASNGQTFTPPNGDRHSGSPRRSALGEITNNEQPATSQPTYSSSDDLKGSLGVADENLPAPTPGQPRKTNKLYGGRRVTTENQAFDVKPDTEIIQMQRSVVNVDQSESEEDRALRMLSRKASQSPVSRSEKRRAVSCTTTTTTTTKWDVGTDGSDVENRPGLVEELDLPMTDRLASPCRPKTPSTKSGNGIGNLSIGKRSSPLRRSTESKSSVRKTSGRVGSVGAQAVRAHKAS